jgi:hypothetical protein
LQLVFFVARKVRYFSGMAPQEDARDDDPEEPSLEALIQAVLNSNTEAIDSAEPLD